MGDRPRRATVHLTLGAGEDDPALDAQLVAALTEAAERGLEIAGVTGTVAGPLNDARRGIDPPGRPLAWFRAVGRW
jgi:hypothetical protein